MPSGGERNLSAPLLAGMLTIPLVFCWFFLRRGYPASLRRAVAIYTATMTLVPLIGRLGP